MIHIAIAQPDIRPYRLPAFNLLASQPDIDLTLFADVAEDAPTPMTDAMRFHYEHAPLTKKQIGPLSVWHQPRQLDAVDASKFDLAILSWNVHYRTLSPALRKAQVQGLPTILWGHGYSKQDSRLRTWIRNRIGRRADGVLLYSHPVAQNLINRYQFDPQRVFVAQNAIDQAPIQQARQKWVATESLAKFRATHRLTSGQTLVYVSRLRDENRPDLLVRAAAQLIDRFPQLTVVFVGDGPERQPLVKLSSELGLAERIRFVGALYSEEDLAPWLTASDVFCYPEAIGLSILTAFGFGLPVVTSDKLTAQNPEIVALRHEENGLLYTHGSLSELVATLGRALSDNDLRHRLADAALKTATEQFTLPRMVQGFLDTTRLVDGRRRCVVVPPA